MGRVAKLAHAAVLPLAVAMSVSHSAHAEDAPDPLPILPAPPLTLTVTPSDTAQAPWTMRITNTGDIPIELIADPRLLVLEWTPAATGTKAGTKKTPRTNTCALPRSARPETDTERRLVVPPKRSWSSTFDPLYYCFGRRDRAALEPGTVLKARFGWPSTTRSPRAKAPKPPFVASPTEASMDRVAKAKTIEGAPFVIEASRSETKAPNDVATPPAPQSPKPPEPSTASAPTTPAPFALSMPAALDVARAPGLGSTVTLRNTGSRTRTTFFRANGLGFTVVGPRGASTCGEPREVSSPMPELFTTLAPGHRATVGVLLTAICPPDTFDSAGIYRVFPRLDTTRASGKSIDLTTWDGTLEGKVPLLVRVQSPRGAAAHIEPRLD